MTKPGQGIRGSVPVSIIRATLFLAAISRVSIVLAQSAGVFTPTGSMTAQRAGHTATLLPNGKVLIAGGYQNVLPDSILASAELYDPSTGMFIATANMSVPRVRHTATLLPDGRVLIAGGATDLSAEIFDPSRGTFAVTGAMVVRPYSWLQAATLLHDGRVLIAGDPTAELYDPVTGTFAATSPYAASAPTYMETAVLLADGRVLLTGGGDVAGWTELYDPATGKFSLAGRMSTWSDVNTATVLTSGKVLFVGNVENDGFPADAEIFDPPSGLFTRLASAAANHEYAAAALLPDGTVLVTGGQLPGGNGEVVSEFYDPATGTFSAAGNMTTPRHEHTSTVLADGSVLIAGGFSSWPSPTASAEIYTPAVSHAPPVLFSISGDGRGQGAIWHASTGQVTSSVTPAIAGEALSTYTTGLVDGGSIPPQVVVGGRPAEILYFGPAPGYSGYNQVNFRVSSGIAPGPAVAVRLTYLGRPSNAVTIALQ